MNQKPQMNVNIDIKNTTPITSPDGIVPVPVFFDVKTGKILVELLPKELRDEFENQDDPI